jgi:Ser/Thr protein kinase RdoA (MazF antagonist)
MNTNSTSAQAQKVAALFGCTAEQAASAYGQNAEQLQAMADMAARMGRKVNGFTADRLNERAAAFRQFAKSEGRAS